MFKKIIHKIFGDPDRKVIEDLKPLVEEINALEPTVAALSDEEMRQRTVEMRAKVQDVEDEDEREDLLEDLTAEAFALVREASRRTTGLRHYDVQLMGGTLLNQGEIVEMRTGEGKTLVATLPLYLNALTGRGSHLVTVNEYLARRDGGWMGHIFHSLGLTVGCIGPQQFSALYDPDYVNPGAELEDERLVHWRPCTRQEAYQADVTYGISSEFGFDYLRDNMVRDPEKLVQRPPNFAVIDEVDNVLIDEARTPLIISGPANQASDQYQRFSKIVRGLTRNTAEEDDDPNGDYTIDEKSRSITLTDQGVAKIESKVEELDVEAGDTLYDPRFFELTYYLENALKAQYMFQNDKDYVVKQGEVIIIDDFTGRLMPGRRYSDGLHEAIEAKEGVDVKRESVTVATITIQNYFRMYPKIAGMTGTAMTDAEEFQEIYDVDVTPLPTNVEYIAEYTDSGLKPRKEKVEGAEKIAYYEPDADKPRFYKRTDYPDQVYATAEAKDQAIIEEVNRYSETGQPVLVGTTSVDHSERIHQMLRRAGIRHNVLNAKMHQSEALVVAQAGREGAVTISTNMAGRGTDILLGGNAEGLAAELMETALFTREKLDDLALRLVQSGPDSARAYADAAKLMEPALVDTLQAKKAEFDAAAERIKEVEVMGYIAQTLQEEYTITYEQVLHVLRLIRTGGQDEAREYLKENNLDTIIVEEATHRRNLHTQYQVALQDEGAMAAFLSEQVFEQHYNARAALVRAVLGGRLEEAKKLTDTIPALPERLIDQIQEIQRDAKTQRERVWELGGLHVIGSERHESRRIDNQLRGRAARQGDPGSSRFFLSLEDELMRRFGGERLKNFMDSNLPEDTPIENRFLDRLIASSQERVEGYNFDIRKNVLEYDDVMARQREATYDDRRLILTGEVDMEVRVDAAFELIIDELVDNYLDNYISYMEEQINRAIATFSAEATDVVNLRGVMSRLRPFLPLHRLDQEYLSELTPDQLQDELMRLAHENEDDGRNIYQLLQAMSRFIPLLPSIPRLDAVLIRVKTGHEQMRDQVRLEFERQTRSIFDNFLANYLDEEEKEVLWTNAKQRIAETYADFNVQLRNKELLQEEQKEFHRNLRRVLRDLLRDSLSTLDSDELIDALLQYVQYERKNWRKRIGDEQYEAFQRTLLLMAIDREWRDYLTAADDLRREIGLESAGRQRDPKVEYKKRSFEMFADMRNNIQKEIAANFFTQIAKHEDYIRRQEAEAARQEQLSNAGYQMVQREQGKGQELRREVPKVGRNDPCPCGSGKKYKQCHLKIERKREQAAARANRSR